MLHLASLGLGPEAPPSEVIQLETGGWLAARVVEVPLPVDR